MSTFGELLEDVQQQMLGKLKDIVANETEHSLVDGDVRRKIATLLEEEMNAANAQVVETTLYQRVVRELTPHELEGIVGDWMRMQTFL